MDINKIKELAEVYLQEQVDLLMRFTSVDSESNYVEGNRQVIDMARAVLETIPGVTMEEMFFEGCGTHLIARIKPEHPEGKIILNSHMDTVFLLAMLPNSRLMSMKTIGSTAWEAVTAKPGSPFLPMLSRSPAN